MYLGLGGSDHDIAACIVSNGKIAVAIEDERVSRKKICNWIQFVSRKESQILLSGIKH